MKTKAQIYSEAVKRCPDRPEFIADNGYLVAFVTKDGNLKITDDNTLSEQETYKFINWLDDTFKSESYDSKKLTTQLKVDQVGICRDGSLRTFKGKTGSGFFKWVDSEGIAHLYDYMYVLTTDTVSDKDIYQISESSI